MFVIEDEIHADFIGEYATIAEAIAVLRRFRGIPWDQRPNVAPCTSWRTCERRYQIIEFDTTFKPWRQIRCVPALNVSARGTEWLLDELH